MNGAAMAYRLYHALLSQPDGPCRCGRTAALKAYEVETVAGKLAALSLVSEGQ